MMITEPTSVAIRGRSDGDWRTSNHQQRLEIGGGISHSITTVSKDAYVFEPCILRMERTEEEKRRRHLYGDKGAKFRKGKQYEPMTDGCSRTITTFQNDNLLMEKKMRYRIRKLIPRECGRLMGVSEKDIDTIEGAGISESQQYKLYGNSIVVDVMYYMFQNLFFGDETTKETLF